MSHRDRNASEGLEARLAPILAAYDIAPQAFCATRISIGLINETFEIVVEGEKSILQRLHPVFGAEVHDDIEAVTTELHRQAIATPRLMRTATGALCVTPEGGEVWRRLTYLDGRVFTRVTEAWHARGAGVAASRFHGALWDLAYDFKSARSGVHDTAAHLRTLQRALVEHRAHENFASVEPIGGAILEHATKLPRLPESPDRIVHGDLKISNVMFCRMADEPLALIDLDTTARASLAIELGDALRSWCNPSGEDASDTRFDLETFELAIAAYAGQMGDRVTADEIGAIVGATETVATELAARFCADALLERYFGWNADRYRTRGEHNLVRARSQLRLAQSIRAQRDGLAFAVERAFTPRR